MTPVRFGAFELDVESGQLSKRGRPVRVPMQSERVLTTLVARPGELVTREELQGLLWPEGSPMDVDHGLNAAVNRLRDALGDAASSPRFIETVPRKGYRFIGKLEGTLETEAVTEAHEREPHHRLSWFGAVVALLGVFVLVAAVVSRDAPVPITSLLVLPLKDLSAENEGDYFALGMTEALISELAVIPDVRIISRSTAMRFRDRERALSEIAETLDVEAVLEGSVVRSGDRVRVTVRLVGFEPERPLWSGSFERNATEILFLQKELSRSVAEEMHLFLTPDVERRLASARTVNRDAHEYVLRGWYLSHGRLKRANIETALEHFKRAVSLDPQYAEPHVGIAASLAVLTIAGWREPNDTYDAQKDALAAALSLDPDLPVAHAWYAQFQRNAEWNWEAAERSYRRAISLSPGSSYLKSLYGGFLLGQARYQDALTQFERARRIDPLDPSPHAMAGWTLAVMKKFESAKESLDRALELEPEFVQAYRALAYYYSAQDRWDESIAAQERATDLSERAPLVLGSLGSLYARAGRTAEARAVLEELRNVPPGRRVMAFPMARVHAALRDDDEALTWLERAYERNEYDLAFLPTGNQFVSLRDEPRFQAIVRGMQFQRSRRTGLPPAEP